MFNGIETYFRKFADPNFFWMLITIPVMVAWYLWKNREASPDIKISSLKNFDGVPKAGKHFLHHVLFGLRMIAICLLVFALARPQSRSSWKNITTEGIDIVLAMDISASMLAKDFKPNRLEASKDVAGDFIESRPNDRIGLVIFSGESFTQCPLTTDHAVILNLFKGVKTGIIADGTAIGEGLANAVSRIKESKAKSKVVILLTDGVNNAGSVAPQTAAEIAKAFGIRVYTIGVGTNGKAYSPVGIYPNGQYVFDYVDVKIDEVTMKNIADMTEGKYFRATNNESLKQIYKEIDKLEKTKFEEKSYTKKAEEFFWYVLVAGVLLLFEIVVRTTVLRSIP